jgi:hypothetical protein
MIGGCWKGQRCQESLLAGNAIENGDMLDLSILGSERSGTVEWFDSLVFAWKSRHCRSKRCRTTEMHFYSSHVKKLKTDRESHAPIHLQIDIERSKIFWAIPVSPP